MDQFKVERMLRLMKMLSGNVNYTAPILKLLTYNDLELTNQNTIQLPNPDDPLVMIGNYMVNVKSDAYKHGCDAGCQAGLIFATVVKT